MRRSRSDVRKNVVPPSASSFFFVCCLLLLLLLVTPVEAFTHITPSSLLSTTRSRHSSPFPSARRIALHSSPKEDQQPSLLPPQQDNNNNNNNDDDDMEEEEEEEEYGAVARLREEAESPFRSLRFFVYGSVAASGAIGALTSLTGALAAYTGVRGAVPLSESGRDVAIDFAAIAIAAFLWNWDSKGKNARLGRLTRGAKIAALKVQLQGSGGDGGRGGERAILSLAEMRRGRGNAKRIVIFAGGQEVVQTALDSALAMKDRLRQNDFLVVPVVVGSDGPSAGVAQEKLTGALDEGHVGWPLLLGEWQEYLSTECSTAKKQGIDPQTQGISIVLKLNGRVGQRAFGQPNWERLVGDVERRRRRGLDVTNI